MVINFPTPQNSFFPEKLTGPQLVKKPPHFAEPEGSLPHSHQPATFPYPMQNHSRPCVLIPLLEDLS